MGLFVNVSFSCPSSVSSSNLAAHMVGSLKKSSKQSLSLPSSSTSPSSSSYNTLPSQHHLMRASTSSPRCYVSNNNHKRSPSSDSGHGTMHNPLLSASSRSNTPVSYHGGKMHHTVYLHGKSFYLNHVPLIVIIY